MPRRAVRPGRLNTARRYLPGQQRVVRPPSTRFHGAENRHRCWCPGGASRQRVTFFVLTLLPTAELGVSNAPGHLHDECPPLLLGHRRSRQWLHGHPHIAPSVRGPHGHREVKHAVAPDFGTNLNATHFRFSVPSVSPAATDKGQCRLRRVETITKCGCCARSWGGVVVGDRVERPVVANRRAAQRLAVRSSRPTRPGEDDDFNRLSGWERKTFDDESAAFLECRFDAVGGQCHVHVSLWGIVLPRSDDACYRTDACGRTASSRVVGCNSLPDWSSRRPM